jgi:hypothetical protein
MQIMEEESIGFTLPRWERINHPRQPWAWRRTDGLYLNKTSRDRVYLGSVGFSISEEERAGFLQAVLDPKAKAPIDPATGELYIQGCLVRGRNLERALVLAANVCVAERTFTYDSFGDNRSVVVPRITVEARLERLEQQMELLLLRR